jgi:hypothetical protein
MQNLDLSAPGPNNRKHYYDIWQMYKANEPLEGEESTLAELMALHKD